eukprot:3755975-Rhodomonas_salina.3
MDLGLAKFAHKILSAVTGKGVFVSQLRAIPQRTTTSQGNIPHHRSPNAPSLRFPQNQKQARQAD